MVGPQSGYSQISQTVIQILYKQNVPSVVNGHRNAMYYLSSHWAQEFYENETLSNSKLFYLRFSLFLISKAA
jgi:hypothetical protein